MNSGDHKVVAAAFSLLLTIPACRGGGPNGEDESGETGEVPCNGCDGVAFACYLFHPELGWIYDEPFLDGCATSELAAYQECEDAYEAPFGPRSQGYTNFEQWTMACANLEEPDDCLYWDPDWYVNFNAGTYEVAEGFIYSLVADPSPLIDCDAGRFEQHVGGGYQLTGASSGELSYVLGLQNGDVVMTLNGLDLDNMDDVLAAFGQLYYENETDFTLVILRGSTPVTLYYELLPPVVP